MKRTAARLLILAALLPLAAHAQGVRDGNGNVIIRDDVAASRGMDPKKPFFTMSVDGNGNYVAPGGGTGGGTGAAANAATTSNGTDGQPTSATNQQNVVYNMLFNGTTWDRMRGTGGAVNMVLTNTPTVNIGTTNGLALDATLTARFGTLGQKLATGSAPVVIASDQVVPVNVANFPATQAISATSLPLPTGAATSANQTSEIAQLTTANQRASYFTEQAAVAVGASVDTNGSSRDAGASPAQWTRYNAVGSSTQAGTLFVQASNDNFTTTVNVVSVALAATAAGNFSATITTPLAFRYYRTLTRNGATAATISVNSSFTVN